QPLPSPTTTRAEKENLRPPLTTLATRLIWTTLSVRFISLALILSKLIPPYLPLEGQTVFTCGFSQGFDSSVIEETVTVEDDRSDVLLKGLLGNRCADLGSRLDVPGVGKSLSNPFHDGGGSNECDA